MPCSLSSSEAGRGLYEREGFVVVDWLGVALEDGWRGEACLVWDPWGVWVRRGKGDGWAVSGV